MQTVRSLTGKLNTDDNPHTLQKGDYPWAENITVSQRDGTASPIIGNRKVSYTLPEGTNVVISKKEHEVRGNVYYLVFNSTGKHSILQYNKTTDSISKILESITDTGGIDILRFDVDQKVVNIDVITRDDEGDILSWTCFNAEPRELIIDKVKNGGYGSVVLEEYIEAAKRPPIEPPSCFYANVSGRNVNALRRKLFQFKSRYVYDDFTKSTWSPISVMPLPQLVWSNNSADVDPTKNNAIDVNVFTGSGRVSKVEIAARESIGDVWSDFFLVTSVDKADAGLGDNVSYQYRFFNDGVYPYIDLRESNLLFDFVPKRAMAQGLANGNVKVYGGIIEGYDRIPDSQLDIAVTVDAVENTVGTSYELPTLTWNGGTDPNNNNDGYFLVEGTVRAGTLYRIFWRPSQFGPFQIFAEYTATASDNASTVAAALGAQQPSYVTTVVGNRINVVLFSGQVISYTNVQEPPGGGGGSDFSGWENIYNWASRYLFGVVYFDEKGRTNGVHLDKSGSEALTPSYTLGVNGGALVPVMTIDLLHRPPSWAKKYQIVRSRNLTREFSLMWKSNDARVDDEYYYFLIQDLYDKRDQNQGYAPSYDFAEGDRVKVVINAVDGTRTFPQSDYIVAGVEEKDFGTGAKKYLKALKPTDAPTSFTSPCLIEIWRPAKAGGSAEDEVYYEFGECYDVYLDNGTPCHRGGLLDQIDFAGSYARTELKYGDVYYRQRENLWISDANYSDYFKSAINANGRPQALDYNQREVFYPTLVRWSLEFQNATSVNNINRFYFDNLDEYDRKYGAIMAFTMRDRVMRVFQKLKVGSVPVYQQLIQDAAGNNILTQSEKILNSIQYYAGDYGVGDHPESIASGPIADYFCDPVRGVVCRVSLDGINPLSLQQSNNDLFVQYLTSVKLSLGQHIYGGFHHGEENEYIIAIDPDPSTGRPSLTITFDESNNGFETVYTWLPEFMSCIGVTLITFKNGELWVHDNPVKCNIFGQQLKPMIELVFNDSPLFKKTFISITETAGEVWEGQVKTSLGQESNLKTRDFRKNEDGFNASFLRDALSPGGISGGDSLKGKWMSISFSPKNGQDDTIFVAAEVKFIVSNHNNR